MITNNLQLKQYRNNNKLILSNRQARKAKLKLKWLFVVGVTICNRLNAELYNDYLQTG